MSQSLDTIRSLLQSLDMKKGEHRCSDEGGKSGTIVWSGLGKDKNLRVIVSYTDNRGTIDIDGIRLAQNYIFSVFMPVGSEGGIFRDTIRNFILADRYSEESLARWASQIYG